MEEKYIQLGKLEVYKSAVQLCKQAWIKYNNFDWQIKKIIGDQFIRSVDSVGANIAEGYGRYHHLDKIRFYYNARGSLFEVKHWLLLLQERNIISKKDFKEILDECDIVHRQLNKFIKSVYPKKKD